MWSELDVRLHFFFIDGVVEVSSAVDFTDVKTGNTKIHKNAVHIWPMLLDFVLNY